MPEERVKRQFTRAIESAIIMLSRPEGSCRVIRLNDSTCPFHIERCREKEVLKIRIVLGEISPNDIHLCQAWDGFLSNQIFTREIWYKKSGEKNFHIKTINPK